jgi:hypothetical protein
LTSVKLVGRWTTKHLTVMNQYDEEIGGHDLLDVIGEQRAPGLGWREG